ncbi:MAG: hypothetical protein LBH04_03055 [Tannerellaceae bacterium]|jgi:hypothetical protein|nr:hypothetical protein [Tannerellaceae bacterium]
MRSYSKEIVISFAALVLLVFAVVAFLRTVRVQQNNLDVNIFSLIPPNAEVTFTINRPDMFRKIPGLYAALGDEIPSVYLSILQNLSLESAVISFYPQGSLCCVQTQAPGDIVDFLFDRFKEYAPLKQEANKLEFYYLPDAENRFLGYYTYKNVWVGSYSSKLLERTGARQRRSEMMLPNEMLDLFEKADKNSPANIIFPVSLVGLELLPEFAETNYLAADLFVSEGNLCAYMYLPAYDEKIEMLLKNFLEKHFPMLLFSFQISVDGGKVALTACAPVGN